MKKTKLELIEALYIKALNRYGNKLIPKEDFIKRFSDFSNIDLGMMLELL